MDTTSRVVRGTCHHDCPDSCGWEVTVEAGRAVRMRGNPDHPYSKGELCPKVNRFLDRVYHPERILTPLVLDGPKGSGRYRAVSWNDALGLVAERLHEIIDTWGGEAIVPWSDAGNQSVLAVAALHERFFARLGASRQVDYICGGTAEIATGLGLGSSQASDPLDVRHSSYVVLWGTNTRLTNRHLWPHIVEARSRGARLVVIDPVRTVTADEADWFIQPRPGTDVAVMLAVIHVILRDGLTDAEYVARHTTGIEELAEHVAEWTPGRAAVECGVDAADIERFAHEYAGTQPAMIRTLIGAEHRQGGAQFFRTLSLLPTLTGSWRHLGGGLARSVGSYAHTVVDTSVLKPEDDGDARRGISMNRLGRALVDESSAPPVKALFVFNGNPLVAAPEAGLLRRGLLRDDLFTVVSEQFMTDTARHADVIFPACTQIEQDDVVCSWGHLHVAWNHKAIDPLGESVPNTELWRRLARAMGFTEPELQASDEELLESCLTGVDIAVLKSESAVRYPVGDDVRPFADGFATADGRFAFASDDIAALGLGRLPEYVPATEGRPDEGQRFPLSLMSPKIHQRFLNTSYSHMDSHAGPEGGPYCEIHPRDAATRGIADGDTVEVFNDRGNLRLAARVSAATRAREGMVIVPFGWHESHGVGGTVNDLTSDAPNDFGGGVAFYDTSVEVRRAG